MIKFQVFTLFPEMFSPIVDNSIIGRAKANNIIDIQLFNIRDYSTNKHKKVDDEPYGGGHGMVMQCQPIYDAFYSNVDLNKKPLVLYASPRGKTFNNDMAKEFSKYENIVILCGHYEGVDQRAIELIGAQEVSIGDYVLTGGELAAMTIIDAVSRFIPGVLGKIESAGEESFSDGLLEYPQYTRPDVFNGLKVPEVLLSGHHKNIEKWQKEQSIELTRQNRPDLYEKYKKSLQ